MISMDKQQQVAGYEDLYCASPDGRIWGSRYSRLIVGYTAAGYRVVKLFRDGKPTTLRRAAVILMAFVGPRPSHLHEASHVNGNRLHDHLENLCWETRIENEARKRVHGTQARGAGNGNSKLQDEAVREIRRLLKSGERQTVIASMFGCSQSAISSIKLGQAWSHIHD